MALEEKALTDNCKKALAFMKENDQVWLGADLANATGIRGIFPVMNSLVKRGLVEKGTAVHPFTNKAGVTADKEYKTYSITDAGRDYKLD